MNLKYKLFATSMACLLGLSAFVVAYFAITTKSSNEATLTEYKEALLEQKKTTLNFTVNAAFTSLKGEMLSDDPAVRESLEQKVANLRFNESPDSYFYIHDSKGIVLAHGSNPDNKGKSQWDLKNSKDQYIVRNIVNAATKGDGYTVFDGYRPSADAFFPKMTYSHYLAEKDMIFTTGFYIDDLDVQVAHLRTELESAFSSTMIQVIVLTLLISAALGAMTYFIVAKFLEPISYMAQRLHQIAEGRGDLTERLNIKGKDEVAQAGQSFDKFIEKLQNIVTRLNTSSAKVFDVANDIQDQNARLDSIMDSKKKESQSMFEAIGHLSESAKQMSDHTGSAFEIANNAKAESSASQAVMREAINSISELVVEVENSSETVDKLNEETSRISSVLSVIGEIAEQTNLLALNAAIEAARAGEQGRGFAVVADEVRALAGRTQQSTQEINEMLTNLQSGVSKAVSSMEISHNRSQKTIEETKNIESGLENMLDHIDQINNINKTILDTSKSQSEVDVQVGRNLDAINGLINKLAEEIQSASEISDSLKSSASEVQEQIQAFKVS